MKYKIILISIFFLAFILRFFQLGANPPSLDWDEASLGYNAYSILKTGKDEYGSFFPLSFRSFGDYKPPLYVYLSTVPVKLFGLNEFSVRFISAFFGSLSVIVGYFLIKKLFPDKSHNFYLLFTIFFSLSPWHIQFSRIAFEANLALFFLILGVWLFLKGLENGRFLPLSFISFGLSVYAYHSPRVIVPLMISGLTVLYFKELRKKLRWLIPSFAVIGLIFITILYQMKSTGARFGSVSVINPLERLDTSIKEAALDSKRGDFVGRLMHNRRIVFAREILAGYLDHFNFDFLFLYGDPPGRHHAAGMGMLYFWDLPFVVIGLISLIGQIGKNKGVRVVFLWFLLAPAASALTTGTPHAVRALFYLPIYQIFAAVGVLMTVECIRRYFNKRASYTLIILIFSFFILNFFYYLHMYYIHTPVVYAREWQYGYKQAAEYTKEIEGRYDKIAVTYRYDQPYIYFLFYNLTDPSWYQNNWGGGEIQRFYRSFGKYEFRNINWDTDSQLKNTLIVGTPDEIPANTPGLFKEINFPDGSVAFRIVGR